MVEMKAWGVPWTEVPATGNQVRLRGLRRQSAEAGENLRSRDSSPRHAPRLPRRAAFTLIEVLVTVLLVSVALVAVMGGIRALGAADAKARDAELLQRLAARKMEELGAVEDPRTAEDSGDFEAAGHPEVEWTMTLEPSGAENVDQVTVTATKRGASTAGGAEQSLTGLLFIRPVTGGAADAGGAPPVGTPAGGGTGQ